MLLYLPLVRSFLVLVVVSNLFLFSYRHIKPFHDVLNSLFDSLVQYGLVTIYRFIIIFPQLIELFHISVKFRLVLAGPVFRSIGCVVLPGHQVICP